MEKLSVWSRNVLAIIGVMALGYCLGASRTVKASGNSFSGNDVEFQLTAVNDRNSLLIYQPGTRTVYVYQGATTGNAALQCSFKFQIDKPGGVIQRIPCPVQSLLP